MATAMPFGSASAERAARRQYSTNPRPWEDMSRAGEAGTTDETESKEQGARSKERGAESGKETAEENLATGDYRLVTVPPVSKPRMHTDEDG